MTKSTDANFRTTYDISNKTNKNFESITIIWSVDMAGTTIEIPQKVRTGLSAHETINIQYSKSNAEDYVTNNLNRSYVSDLVFGIDLKKIKWELK